MALGVGVMKTHLILRQAGLAPNDRVIQRISELKGVLRTGKLPADLLQKLESLPEHQRRQTSILPLMAEALRGHHSGGSRLPEPLAALAHYTLAYLWEEHDDISDTWCNGFADDLRVMAQVSRHSKRDLDDLRLKSRRTLIQEGWSNGHAALHEV
jgi:hypothetical protein